MANDFPDYYAILEISPSATQSQIKASYKRLSLIHHPDRINSGPNVAQRRREATVQFQKIADAYFVLSDDTRKANYDRLRRTRMSSGASTTDESSKSYFERFFNYAGNDTADPAEEEVRDEPRPDPGSVFGDVFEELLRPEVESRVPLWTWAGAGAGAVMGFIVGNLPGAAVGGYGGSKLGAIRDAKGKAVYHVFMDLGADQKAEILRNLAFKVLGSAASSLG
ncbi:DnaJ-domain-containing protein [Atractiella rhizophila]|nr:DnaJ-domain-containing protein [Atractiella rhizophila]